MLLGKYSAWQGLADVDYTIFASRQEVPSTFLLSLVGKREKVCFPLFSGASVNEAQHRGKALSPLIYNIRSKHRLAPKWESLHLPPRGSTAGS